MRTQPGIVATLALLCPAWAYPAPQLIIINAKVFTADPARPWADALAIESGRFSAVGGAAEIRALAGKHHTRD